MNGLRRGPGLCYVVPRAQAWSVARTSFVDAELPVSRRFCRGRRRSALLSAASPKSLPRRGASLPPPPGWGWGGECGGGGHQVGRKAARSPRPSRDYISRGASAAEAAAAAGAATSPGSGVRDFHSCVRRAEPETRAEAELGI